MHACIQTTHVLSNGGRFLPANAGRAYVHMHTYMPTCVHAYMHTCMHTYILTYYMHTCILRTGRSLHASAGRAGCRQRSGHRRRHASRLWLGAPSAAALFHGTLPGAPTHILQRTPLLTSFFSRLSPLAGSSRAVGRQRSTRASCAARWLCVVCSNASRTPSAPHSAYGCAYFGWCATGPLDSIALSSNAFGSGF